MTDIIIKYYNLKKMHLFAGVVLAYLIIIWLSKKTLINEIVFYNTFSEQLTFERSMKLFEDLKRYSWIEYVFAPIMLLIKILLVSLVLYVGVFLFDIQNKVSPGSVFRIVIASEVVFILASLFKFIWFYFFAGNYTLNDLSFFYPLSLINFFRRDEVNSFWIFPLQIINIFQFIYILSLSYGMNKTCEVERSDTEKIVLSTYLPAMVIWVALIMFLSIDTLSL